MTMMPVVPVTSKHSFDGLWDGDVKTSLPTKADDTYTVELGRHHTPVATSTKTYRSWAALLSLTLAASILIIFGRPANFQCTSSAVATGIAPFFSSVKTHVNSSLCPGMYAQGGAVSHSGHIGLKGDTEDDPRRAFFWFFESQTGSPDAPIILTIGGGPGTSGMLNPLIGQSHCRITANGTVPNPNAWTENFNLLALDHPIGVGFSYGRTVNNSRDAAIDTYEFLQKFYTLFPQVAKNPLVLASGSYGGTYIPHIATVIHEQNMALGHAEEKGRKSRPSSVLIPGAQHINFESMMVSNPYSDILHHRRWANQQRCYLTDLYNTTQCQQSFELLPDCLEAIQVAYEQPSRERKRLATKACQKTEVEELVNRSHENVRWRCDGRSLEGCVPEAAWAEAFFNNTDNKAALGVPDHVNFSTLNMEVFEAFRDEGDLVQKAYLLYEPLLEANYRLLHYVGREDANCAWPGVIAFLKIIRSRYQDAFIAASDIPWATSPDEYADVTTVRAIGPSAGNMTYILLGGAGHMVTKDQPVLVKSIVEHWVENREWTCRVQVI